MIDDEEREQVLSRLAELRVEHRDLDEIISRLGDDGQSNQLQIVRLKKRKLLLKDEISRVESTLVPDIIA
ncbi:DUF465 domain-containing protein [Haematospirillum jordaniae]|uniref:YdcH family protein n=1 Tax=Haematospirillum TaxID=1804663 RepID=UPI0009EF2AE2|nr:MULTISPECIES: DUF465 domain-containing protein [Haematospirillum]NKD44176.1 DUF465 domain-containing protein [Haematospirillum jordaniae]NKD56554.1 DUF465 domain-containing protein [Haematospirillum jordaniae]NKD58612.1 DUF465 domain-containing protein [Haematospirillum jordaniae]NKD66219.1 DUF465 domain-containing protein [Haematospirillum jordaniae]NKD76315.1 DUF465 domain-containing protein [Haematospirillum sp. H1815]